ncbi:MAG TPA: hypothetical protein VD788_01640 [Candidatus Polarisedimenticolaceae bacterium]|nr:hypothetical protein [Candidatus Polarisedimenticolaceae bacterium]
MRGGAAGRYALGSLTTAVSAAIGMLLVVGLDPRALGWALAGWAWMTLVGVGGGAWIAARHGDPGPGFLKALGTCILSRLAGAAGGAALAASHGADAVWPYLAGLGTGFVPLQVFEIGWFLRRSRGWTVARGGDALGH